MWQEIIETCETYVDRMEQHSVDSLGHLLNSIAGKIPPFKSSRNDLPYGRYLIHNDIDDRFNIQLDIFSEDYEGSIHCHETWGLLSVLKGALIVEQWHENEDETFLKLSESFLPHGGIQTFCPPASDWHKVRTASPDEQVVSLHIYGNGFNLDSGIYLDPDFMKTQGTRSAFKDLRFVEGHFDV